MKKEVERGGMIPKLYGVAYYDYMHNRNVCYPIFINLIARWVRSFYFFIARPREDWISKEIKKAYDDGYNTAR